MKEKVLFAWSGGKDSALALQQTQVADVCQVEALLTTVTEGYDRSSMHGVRRELLEDQAESLGYPLEILLIPRHCTDENYQARMQASLERWSLQGVSAVGFGDVFLEEIRAYRERNLGRIGLKGFFPIWGTNTERLAQRFMDLNFKAIVTCVDGKALDGKYAGREYDRQFLADLPDGVDPCGENGEFHTFVYDGPIFRNKVIFTRGEIVLRDNRFYFCDLLVEKTVSENRPTASEESQI